ncbi:MAG: hypothetical protein K2O40_13220 [Lachnospiraceae bacterium]|nr:hypothetical protein [Lachnospiraceae bacterium]MDE7185391.1 hypothetical protein [Lachnospiraceae bacterium]
MSKDKIKKKKEKESKGGLKKIFNKNTFLSITLAGMLVLVMIYVFVYMDYTQKTEDLTASNEELKKVVDELQQYSDNIEEYKEEIEGMRQQIEQVVAEYPADAREEDIVMLAVELQERNVIGYDAINMEEREGTYSIPGDLVKAAAIEGLDEELVFAQKHAVYVNTTNYDNLKSIIEQVYLSDNRIGIDNIAYAKDEENGTLEGNIDIYFYSLAGTDKEYASPDIAAYLSGTSDLFKSDKINAKNIPLEMEGAEGMEGGEVIEGDGAEGNEETVE